ncbi:MAG TPA: SpoIIE family protein phosphatase [Pyrinomonadaceae bacterium]|nr:SpoIIE family protein phosphatase [Pyrinomonadaceae bacterium]
MAKLIIQGQDGNSEKFDLTRLRTTIGRSARNDICIPDSFASRLHCEIRREGDVYWLNDLGSANGTKRNGIIVRSPVKLNSGDEIQLGETRIFFVDEDNLKISAASLATDTTDQLDPSKTISFSFRPKTTEFLDEQLTSRTDLLKLISKVGVTLLSARSLSDTLGQIANLVFESVPAERCVIMMKDSVDDEMKVILARSRHGEDSLAEIKISRTIMDEVLKNGKSVLTADAQHDPRYFSQTMALQGIRSVLAVPLSVDEKNVFGMIYADSPTFTATFSEEHLNILTTLASVASIRVENAKLLEERFERERLERELELASEIQQRFQPSAPPQISGYEFQGISFSCYEIGGDYYDFVQRPNGNLFIALGDVSGKGTAAALLMSSLHAAVHAQLSAGSSLSQLLDAVNRYLAENTPANRFVTFFAAELSPSNGKLNYINAGHNPPLIARRDNTVETLPSSGLPLGIMEGAEYELAESTLNPGELLVAYSDGVTEAVNPQGEEFSLDRLIKVIKENQYHSAAQIRDRIESALSSFTQTADANDDITLVIIKRSTA